MAISEPNLDAKTAKEAKQQIEDYLASLIGRTIVGVSGGVVHHSLDSIYGPADASLNLDDGRTVTFCAGWCNDSTADLDIDIG